MKYFRFYTANSIFLLIFCGFAFAQAEKSTDSTTGKIGFIDTEAFDNETTGIREVFDNYEKLRAEFKPQTIELTALAEKIQKLDKEMKEWRDLIGRPWTHFKISESLFRDKEKEYESLISQYKLKESTAKYFYEKRRAVVFAEVDKRISDAMRQFAKEKGYTFILDLSKIEDSDVLVGKTLETDDLTKEFIKYYNENFAKAKTQ